MDTPIPEFLAEAANRRVSDIFIIAGRPLAERSTVIFWTVVTG